MANQVVEIPATLTIDTDLLTRIIQNTFAPQMAGQYTPPSPAATEAALAVERKPRARKPKPKPEPPAPEPAPTPEPPSPEKKFKLKLDPNMSFVEQVRTTIVQIAMQAHGDAVARQIMNQWNTQADTGIETLHQIYPSVGVATIAEAVAESQEATLRGLPSLFIQGLFAVANSNEAKAYKVAVCGICEGENGHKPGCPNLTASRMPQGDGGAIPSRVPNVGADTAQRRGTEPAQGEVCGLGGPGSGCIVPSHVAVRQGGTHIYVHPPEVMASIRAAMSVPEPTAGWDAPPPPVPGAARLTKPKRGRPKGKKP